MTVAEGILLAVSIVVFFVAAALLVRVLHHMITHAGLDSDSGDEAAGPEPEPGGPGRAR
jgi:hypothetical protein